MRGDVVRGDVFRAGVAAVLSTAFGVLLASPLEFIAAHKLTPVWASWTARAFIALLRRCHPVIVAMITLAAIVTLRIRSTII